MTDVLARIDRALKIAALSMQEVVKIAVPPHVYAELIDRICSTGDTNRDYEGSCGHALGTHVVYRGFGGFPYPIVQSVNLPGLYGCKGLLAPLDFETP